MWCLIIVELHILVLCNCHPAVLQSIHSFPIACPLFSSLILSHSCSFFIPSFLHSSPSTCCRLSPSSLSALLQRSIGPLAIAEFSETRGIYASLSSPPQGHSPNSFPILLSLRLRLICSYYLWFDEWAWQTLCRPSFGQSSIRWTIQRKSVLTCCILWATRSTQLTVLSHLVRHPFEIPSVNFSLFHQGIFNLIKSCLSYAFLIWNLIAWRWSLLGLTNPQTLSSSIMIDDRTQLCSRRVSACHK